MLPEPRRPRRPRRDHKTRGRPGRWSAAGRAGLPGVLDIKASEERGPTLKRRIRLPPSHHVADHVKQDRADAHCVHAVACKMAASGICQSSAPHRTVQRKQLRIEASLRGQEHVSLHAQHGVVGAESRYVGIEAGETGLLIQIRNVNAAGLAQGLALSA